MMTGRSIPFRKGIAMFLALELSAVTVAVAQPMQQPQEVLSSVVMAPPSFVTPDAVLPAATEFTPPAVADTNPITIPLPPQPAPDISVTESQLVSVVSDVVGGDTVTQTNVIPYIVGRSCYNWVLKFDPVQGDLLLTEELRLPGPARNWGIEGASSEVNPQGSAAITSRHFDAMAGIAMAGWCVAKDDPVGAYRYIIRQGDRELAQFDFTVGDLL